MNLPAHVRQCIDALEEAGYSAYAVGGCVRDWLLGLTPHDFDLCTSALPEQICRVFAHRELVLAGLKHGTVGVIFPGEVVEITTYRTEGGYSDSRHPDWVRFVDRVEDDLSRRDFTVNAMAYSPRDGLVDLFGGQEDLDRRIMRAVGAPALRFSEDALRILRAFRFMSKLDFDIDADTLSAARETRTGLLQVSAERITAELCGLLEGRAPARALTAMVENGIFEAIAPDFHPDAKGIALVECMPCDFELRMAAFLRYCGDKGESLLARLRLSNKSTSRIRTLLLLGDCSWPSLKEPYLRRLMAQAGRYADDLIPLAAGGFFDLSTRGRRLVCERMKAIRARGDCLSPKELAVNGRHLIGVGFSGADVGRVLTALYEAVLDDPAQNQEDILMQMAEKMRH